MTSTHADCCGSRARSRYATRRKTPIAWLVPLALVAALVPKCPLCLAAQLVLLGVGTSAAAALAPWLMPVALALTLVIALLTAAGALIARQARAKNR